MAKISDQRMMQQCSTAHERRAKAQAASDDYFGRELRKAATVDAGSARSSPRGRKRRRARRSECRRYALLLALCVCGSRGMWKISATRRDLQLGHFSLVARSEIGKGAPRVQI